MGYSGPGCGILSLQVTDRWVVSRPSGDSGMTCVFQVCVVDADR